MLIGDHWLHAVYKQQLSDNEKNIWEKTKKNRKMQSKNIYAKIAYNIFFVCVCVCVCVSV